MNRKELRRQVLYRERQIKQMLGNGMTRGEVAEALGVSTQRVYDFMHRAKHRPKLVGPIERINKRLGEERQL